MKIGFVIPSFYPATTYGGPAFASWHLAKALGARGHHVRVSTTNANMHDYLPLQANSEKEMAENVFVTYYHDTFLNRLSLPQIAALDADIRKSEVVHVHAVFNMIVPMATRMALLRKRPVLLTPHGCLSPDALLGKRTHKELWLRSLIRPFATKIAWHATSAVEAHDIQAATGGRDIFTIRHGLPSNMPTPAALDRTSYFAKFAPDCAPGRVIASMGRLEKTKGFDVLIRAFHGVREKMPDTVLLIAGPDQGERARLIALTRDLSISKQVIFLDFLDEQDRSDFLGNADLFALASHHENFGLVYAEALALGTPIVATTNTPWKGVDEAGCGRWVSCEPRAIEEAITTLLQQDRATLHDSAVAYSRQFMIEDVAALFESAYQRIGSTNG